MNQPPVDLKALLSAVQENKPALKCSSGRSVSLLCISRECTISSCFCLDQSCETCVNPHSECECVMVSSLTKILKGLAQQQQKITNKLVTITENMIREIKKKMQEYEDEVCLGYLTTEELNSISTIYLKEPNFQLKGDFTKDLFRKLKQVQNEIKDLEFDLVVQFEKEAGIISKQLNQLQENTFSEFKNKFKAKLFRRTPKIVEQYELLRKRCISVQSENRKYQQTIKKIREEKNHLQQEFKSQNRQKPQTKAEHSFMQEQLRQKTDEQAVVTPILIPVEFSTPIVEEDTDEKEQIQSVSTINQSFALTQHQRQPIQELTFHSGFTEKIETEAGNSERELEEYPINLEKKKKHKKKR